MEIKSIMSDLNHQWTKAIRIARRYLRRSGAIVSKTLYRILGRIHLALITDAGLIIVVFAPCLFGAQLKPKPISLVFFTAYVICDLGRLRFLRGATISLGFPLIFLTLLADSPFAALLNSALGSWVSEVLRSRLFSKQRLPWFPTLRRAFFYAGHHAVAGFGALIAYQSIHGRFASWLLMKDIHIQATLAYIIVYSLVSMLLIWPHDRRLHLFLASDEEPFVRIDFLTTLLLLPLPASVFYLYNLNLGQTAKILIVIGFLPPLFVLLFYLARNFTKMAEKQEQLALREEISQRLGSPANMAEMVKRMLTIMGELVKHRWGAVYSMIDGELRLCGDKSHKGPIVVRDPIETRETKSPSGDTGTDENQVTWPPRIKPGEGTLGKLAKVYFPLPQFFDHARGQVTPSDPYLPRKTALIVYPITVRVQGEAELLSPNLIGMIALARPKRRFTTWDQEKGQALSSKAGNVLLGVQRLERTIQELYQKVEDYATDREKVRQAMQALIRQQVDVSKILAVVAEHSFHGNLRAVLRGVVEGRRGDEISLAPETLTEIYNQVRDETPGMPPLDPDTLQLLQTVISSLSLAFSFQYQFPEVKRGPAFKAFYEFLLVALEANTVSRIVALDAQIVSTAKAVRERERALRETLEGRGIGQLVALPPEALEEVEKLRDIVHLLKKSEQKDLISQKGFLSQALDLLIEHERNVQERLQDPERFVFLQILASWRTAITNALEDLARGPARLTVRLRSHQALPLEEITVSLVLQNDGPGVASGVMIELEPSSDYKVLRGKVDLGTLTANKIEEPEFSLRPKGEGPLRLQFRITYHDPERKGKVEKFADLLRMREPPPCFAEIPNPYTPGKPLKPGNPTFVGREDIFALIRRKTAALVGKMILVLVGERRTGKTSILQQLPARLNDSSYIPVYIDGNALGIDTGMENFFLSLAEAIADGLERGGISISRLTPAELGESPRHVFERRFLPMVREEIGERILLLTIDEFEDLGDRASRDRLPREIFPYLRHLIQHGEQMAFIFAGTHKVEKLIGDYWSVLFNIAEYKKIEFLSRDETIYLITELVEPYGMVYDDLAIDEILRLTACHPYFTQLLCSILVDQCNEERCSYVTVQNVRNAVEALLEASRAHLVFLWQTSDQEARLTMATLAELRDRLDRVTAAAIADQLRTYQISPASGQIIKAMEQLAARGIAREIPGSLVSYDFTAQLYARWLRHYKPLSKVVEEINSELVTG